MQEFLVKNADRVELMSMLGLFGAFVSAIQMYPLVLDVGNQYLQELWDLCDCFSVDYVHFF